MGEKEYLKVYDDDEGWVYLGDKPQDNEEYTNKYICRTCGKEMPRDRLIKNLTFCCEECELEYRNLDEKKLNHWIKAREKREKNSQYYILGDVEPCDIRGW